MKLSNFRKLSTALVVVALMGFSGCGVNMNGDTSSKTSDSKSSSKSDDTDSAIPDNSKILDGIKVDKTLQSKLPDSVKKAGAVTIGSYIQAPPNNMYRKDGKTPAGDEVDLAKAIGKKLGIKMNYKDMSFDSLVTGLESGRVDMTMAAMNDTKARQEKVDFVDYYTAGITFLVRKGNPKNIKNPDTLCGTKIAVAVGSSQEAYAKERAKICETKGKPKLDLTVTQSDTQNQTQLQTGRVDVILHDLPSSVYIAKTAGHGKLFEMVDYPSINAGPLGIGFNKKDSQLRDCVQQALQSLMDDGTYMKLFKSWGLQGGAIKQATVNTGE